MKNNQELLLFQKYLEAKNKWMLSKFYSEKEAQLELKNHMLSIKDQVTKYEDNQLSISSKNSIYDQIQSYIDSIKQGITF